MHASYDFFIFRLDPALIRPGRVDFQTLISYCTPYQIQQLFFNFYPEGSQAEADNFNNRLKELGMHQFISPAALQGHFLMYKNSPASATENLNELRIPKWMEQAVMTDAIKN